MEQVYHAIKTQKPGVKVGISQFGIWRPKNPPSIKGFDAYAEIYADSLKWLREGWGDYFAPQLYWGIAPPQTSFTTLLDWWNGENVRHRHIWPGMNSLNAGEKWPATEIVNQINATRRYADAGQIHWSVMALMKKPALEAALARDSYRQPALIPASPWLGTTPPAMPKLSVIVQGKSAAVRWENPVGQPAALWVLQILSDGFWRTDILPANQVARSFQNYLPDAVAVRAVDRVGNLSAPAIWSAKALSAPAKGAPGLPKTSAGH